jgi:uncharacterized damage-inducible protein DinB
MRVQDMLTLYKYNYWANRRILAAATKISQEQLSAPSAHSLGSLRRTLLHTLDAEFGWRMRCQHNQSTPDPSEANFPTLDAIERRWGEEEAALRAYLAGLRSMSARRPRSSRSSRMIRALCSSIRRPTMDD